MSKNRRAALENVDNWDSHWGDFGVAITASPAQAMRHSLAIQLFAAEHLPTTGNVVDFGSGHGDFLSKFHQRFPAMNLLGLELSETGVQISRHKLPSAHFVVANLLTPPPALEQYKEWADGASCLEVLEHVDDPVLFLKVAKNYLKNAATLVITVPGGRMSALDRFIGHRRHFDKEAIRSVLQEAGFEVTKVMLAGFPFFNLYRLMIIGRGDKLATDLKKRQRSWLVKVLLTSIGKVAEVLFHFNLADSRFGWQVVAVARNVRAPASVGSER
jgi:2-polyprenyl-3-methyl-5-hydroxy-6-metoxy-1,4-benzoquinol methylase